MSRRRNPNLGCIDPHGMYPFPASREVCPKCQAIRSRNRGLRYGWWKSADFWAFMLVGILLAVVILFLLEAWFRW